MTPEQEIKQTALQRGADQVGIAAVSRVNEYAPPGHRPDDILIGARSVVVFAGRTTPRGAWRSLDYRTHYNNRDFPRVRTGIAMAVAKLIESKYGYYSIGQVPPPTGFNPSLSFKLCAEMAGLGTRSMAAGIILNRELGLLNFSVCITTMPLTADQPMTDPICPHPSCVELWQKHKSTPCLDVCPECLSGELEGKRIKWMRYDRRICSTRAQNEGMGALQRIVLEGVNEPDPERRKTILLGSFSRAAMEAVASGNVTGQCSECVRVCPIHRDAQKLKPLVPIAERLY